MTHTDSETRLVYYDCLYTVSLKLFSYTWYVFDGEIVVDRVSFSGAATKGKSTRSRPNCNQRN